MTTAWTAIYRDGTRLRQFNEDKTENLFKDIQQDKLFEFRIIHNERVLSVFLPTGTFGIGGFLLNSDVSCKVKVDYRLIYFSRKRKVLGPQGKNSEEYIIGFQCKIENTNYKRLIKFSKNEIQFVNN